MNKSDELSDRNFNQDNTKMWVNPMFQNKRFRLLIFVAFIPTLYAVFYCIRNIKWVQLTSIDRILLIAEILILVFSIMNVIYNKIKTKLNVIKLENQNTEKMNFEYYRDILDEMSAGVLSFCYNKKVKYSDTIISLLLILKKNNYIDIDIPNRKIIFVNKETFKLNEHEKFFYSSIIKDNYDFILFDEFNKIINNDMFKGNFLSLIKVDTKKQGYFVTQNFSSDVLKYTLLFNTIIMFIKFLTTPMIGILYFFITIILFLLLYIVQKNVYIKTTKGNEINSKLIGLRKYIIEFSVLPDRKMEELELWDYYMIYAIIFDLKGNLNNEVNKLFNSFKI